MKSKPIIVALDFARVTEATEFASRLDPALCRVKVGKELHTAGGPQVVDALMAKGFEVFLDLKFHDIPNTVASACKVAASQGVWMMNVHAAGGSKMLAAARNAVDATNHHKSLLIAVTVLTSLAENELAEIGLGTDMRAAVERFAALTAAAGLDGVVSSAQEATWLKSIFGAGFQVVTPGIRLAEDAKGDQSRVVTPDDAIRMGADYLVIGRSITQSSDPVATLQKINNQLKTLEEKV